jgi:hypothetical protein
VFDRILLLMKEKIKECQYVMTTHAEEEMNDEDLSIFDIERGILTGKIVERQQDKVTSEWKYRITGQAVDGSAIEVITKLGPTNKLVIITVYVP